MELYFKTRDEWREWLLENHTSSDGIWLIYYKKPSGKPRIPYNDAVEEALCFGWIDGKIKRINEEYYIQRFTPRRSGSRWSKYNVERVQKMIDSGRMQPAGLLAYKEAISKPELVYQNRTDAIPDIPDDLALALRKNKKAGENFTNYSTSVRRLFIEFLNSAKREETRIRRINKIIDLSEKNLRPGINSF
jgi:uncharacterized protein YdeI (YjbR/CyaY-like superfamily)